MTAALRHYLELEAKLSRWRAEHPKFSAEEEQLLDEIEAIRSRFNGDEIAWLRDFLRVGTCAAKRQVN